MKRTFSSILSLPLVAIFFLSNSFAQNYVHYATLKASKSWIALQSLAFSPDGHTLASGGYMELILWDVVTGLHKTTLAGHTSMVENIAFSPDGRTLASSSRDDSIYLWDAISGVHLKTLIKDPPIIDSLVFSPDGHILAAGGGGGNRSMGC